LGLNFRIERLPKLIAAYYHIIVWTDNDCDAARQEAERIRDMAACLGKNVAVVSDQPDPKAFFRSHIQLIIRNQLKS
jgi:hypothetical protein